MALGAVVVCWGWTVQELKAQWNLQGNVELVCPCEVSTNSLTSIDVSFGVRNYDTGSDSGPLTAVLLGRRLDSRGRPEEFWRRMANFQVPAVAANSTRRAQAYTSAFSGRVDERPGTYELQLRIRDQHNSLLQSIRWVAERVELGHGGHSYTSIYFGGIPTVELGSESAELTLPVIKNATGGTLQRDIEVYLKATRAASFNSETIVISRRHSLDRDLAPGEEIARQSVTIPFSVTDDDAYVHVALVDGSTNFNLVFQTISVPDDEELPTRTVDTGDASLLVDSDDDGVGDVNERLAGTDPEDANSTPEDPMIDVLALYQPNFPAFYGGNPTTRISHVLKVAQNIYKDSGVGLNFRLVGILEAQIDEPVAVLTRQVNEAFLIEAMESHGADMVVVFHALQPSSRLCGWADLGGFKANGAVEYSRPPMAHVAANCRNTVTAHEIGHVMGLGHSYVQNEVGTYRWSRGHGVRQSFVTVMAYWNFFDYAPELNVFSTPDRDCEGKPCGVAIDKTDGADAVTSLNITRFQVANYGEQKPDSDDDGFVDPVDAFPNDPEEHLDTDDDGVGNNADTDDDNDDIADSGDAFPLDADEWRDTDGDAVGDNSDSFPEDRYEAVDTDGDGVGDNADRFPNDASESVDTDDDGVGNNADDFPYDTREWLDTDGDGTGDNADTDDDGDGIADIDDAFPLDSAESADTDGDGIGNNADTDDDGDGVADDSDALPLDPEETLDADGDGVGDNADAFPNDAAESVDTDGDGTGDNADTDDDNDGVRDSADAYPKDSSESADTDGDGVGDNADAFPNDATESADTDGDGVGDNADAFPNDATESVDTDGDGIGNNADADDDNDGTADADDALPLDPMETADADGDGVGDNADAFPNDAAESVDTDGDGTGNNADTDDDGDGVLDTADAFPKDAAESVDTDGDGVGDNADVFPSDATEWLDNDSDGTGDNADSDDDNDGHTDAADAFPLDASRQRLFYYRLSGEKADAEAGRAVAGVGDADGDGIAEVLIGSPRKQTWGGLSGGRYLANHGAAYVVSGADLAASDGADGLEDGRIDLQYISGQPKSWALTGERSVHRLGISLSALGDIDGDERPEWLVGALGYRPSDVRFPVGAAYVVSPSDLLATDMADVQDGVLQVGEIGAQTKSWEFMVEEESDHVYTYVSAAGDVNGDGVQDVLLGLPEQSNAGLAYVVSGAHLSELDAKDDTTDGRIDLQSIASHTGSWKFLGEKAADRAGSAVSSAGDIDGDGQSDLIIASLGANAVYVVAAADLAAADEADGSADGVIRLANVKSQPKSWKLNAETNAGFEGFAVAAGDVDGNGTPELLISSPGYSQSAGAVYVVSVSDLSAADAADGVSDHVVGLEAVAGRGSSWKLLGEGGSHWSGGSGSETGRSVATFDLDGDAISEVLISAPAFRKEGNWCPAPGEQQQSGAVYLVSGKDLAAADAADGVTDGVARLENVILEQYSWKFSGESTDSLGSSVAAAGDLNGDGASDLIFGAAEQFGRYAACGSTPGNGLAIVLSGADLADADRADGAEDGIVDFQGLRTSLRSADFDLDGTENALDTDDDNDGAPDATDDFPFDPLESSDNDSDGIGDNADTDDDNDGVLDSVDAFPMNSLETLDSDGDGTGDNSDPDDDNDGTNDTDDAFPFDPTETADSDGDGIGDNADPEPNQQADVSEPDTDGDGIADRLDDDDDNDGVDDAQDLFDLDASRSDLYYYRLAGSARGLSGSDFDGDGLDDLVVGTATNSSNAYLVSAAELSTADNADGKEDRVIDFDQVTTLEKSWKFVGIKRPTQTGTSEVRYIDAAGDIDQDGSDDVLVVGSTGTLLIPASSLSSADSRDGDTDRTINLSGSVAGTQTGAFALSGSPLGEGVYRVVEFNSDVYGDLLIGNLWDRSELSRGNYLGRAPSNEAAYLISGSEWMSSDGRDGVVDGRINLDRLTSRPHTWKFTSEAGIDFGASVAACGDINGDGVADLVLGAPGYSSGTHIRSGRVFILSGDDLGEADGADGASDGVIAIDQSENALIWTLDSDDLNAGMTISCLGDVDGDGREDLLIGAQEGVYLLAGQDMKTADTLDGASDGNVQLSNMVAQANSRRFRTTLLGLYEISGLGIGDVDGDGHADILLTTLGAAYLLSGRELPDFEAVDGTVDIDHAVLPTRTWKFVLTEEDVRFTGVASIADLNGDGSPEFLLETRNRRTLLVRTYVISSAELGVAAGLERFSENVIYLDQIAGRWRED